MKTILKNIAAAVLLVAPILSNAQVATRLQFPNPTKMVEFGYSVTEYEGYSLFGSEFRNAVNVYQNGTFKFQAVGPLESNFGHAIGMNRDYIAVGAYQANNRRGVVYLSKSINGQAQNNFNTIISAQTPVNNDQFGKAIDIHNEWMVIAAPNVNGAEHSGYIELWKLVNGTWARNSVIRNTSLPANAEFGNSVAIRGDRVVVGAPGINKVFIYRLLNNAWVLEKTYEPNAPTWANTSFDHLNMPVYSMRFGYDVDITDNNIIVGDPTSAKAAILTLQNGNWVLTKTLLPPASLFTKQTFGNSVAIQYNRAVVGAPRSAGGGINRPDEGKAYFYTEGYNYKYVCRKSI